MRETSSKAPSAQFSRRCPHSSWVKKQLSAYLYLLHWMEREEGMVLWHHVIFNDMLVGFPPHSPFGGGLCLPHGPREVSGLCTDAAVNLFTQWGF